MTDNKDISVCKNQTIDNKAKQQVALHFGHSAHTYHLGARLQKDVTDDLLSLLGQFRKTNDPFPLVLDLGAGPGLFSQTLQAQSDVLISVDLCDQMLKQNVSCRYPVQADSHHLPLLSDQFDLVFSSLMIQWCQFDQVIEEVKRVLKPNGKAIISSLVKGTLAELESAWAEVDDDKHIHDYLTLSQVQQSLISSDWNSVKVHTETKTYYFDSAKQLAKELKHLGANLVQGRKKKGMMTKSKWAAMETAYRQQSEHSKLPASYKLVYLELIK